jgi:four helix bundle protein
LERTIEKPIDRRSKSDFRNKIQICESECSETQYWLEVVVEAELLLWKYVKPDYDECSELLAIFTSIINSLDRNL